MEGSQFVACCGYKFCFDTQSDPKKLTIVSPEGMPLEPEITEQNGGGVTNLIEQAAPIVEQDIEWNGCNAPWSCGV